MATDYSAQRGLKAVEILNGWRTTNGTHMAALHIHLEKGWKTYWRAPGGNGIPPIFKWKGSKNIAAVRYHWPSPSVFIQDGIRTVGYTDRLILPIEIKPANTGQPIKLKGRVDFGVCADVCIPITSRLETILNTHTAIHQDIIKASLSRKAVNAKSGGVRSVVCTTIPGQDGIKITANLTLKNTTSSVQHVVIELPQPNIWVNPTGFKRSGNTLAAQAELISLSSQPFFLDRSKLKLTVIRKGQKAIEINGCPASG